MLAVPDDPRLDALDQIRRAMGKIYDAKRAHTATPQDDARMKELHAQWMIVMKKLTDPPRQRGD
jgi:hypothetical protein